MNLSRLHPRSSWSVLVVMALVATTLALILRSDGNIVPELDLHDAGIWVSNESAKIVGRTNTEIKTVDTKLDAESSPFDVLQSGAVVMLRQQSPSRLAAIDPSTSKVIAGSEIPDDAAVSLGGATSALFDASTGRLFVAAAFDSTAALGLDPANEDTAVHTIEGRGALAVGVDGLAHLLDIEAGEITTWNSDGTKVDTRSVDGDLAGATITAVGSTPVVLADGVVLIPGRGSVDVSSLGSEPQLQQPGPSTDAVLVAASGGFVRVPLSGGDPEEIEGAGHGVPAAPVFVAGCSYGAWGGDLAFVQSCSDRDPRVGLEPALQSGDRLMFRVNRNRVTLNNLANGKQLLFGDDDPIFIDNEWAEALTDESDEEPDDDEQADDVTEPECEGKNNPPTAEPDADIFGTRPGRPVIVYPLRNDTDPDCDVLLIDSVKLDDPSAGKLGIVEQGRAVQVAFAQGVRSLRFGYTISDGRGGKDSSFVTVRVVPEGENSPPVVAREETTVVTGGTITHNVLQSAYDPDGDVMRLKSATLEEAANGTVRSNVRGEITFTASNTIGVTEITFVVTDGEEEATGKLRVKVVDSNVNQPPNARADSITTFVGREAVFDVLDNDTDPDGDSLSIARVTSDSSAQVSWDPTSPEIRVVADEPGTVNVTYRITDGLANDEAVFRVDVLKKVDNLPPIAVRDEVLLTPGVPAYVPVLENDVDPDGSVLVVLGVSGLPQPSPITVTVLQRSILKIVSTTPLADPISFDYRISDGATEVQGRVLVENAPVNTKNRPPVAVPDEYTVRAGGIAVLPVLANDSDPDADPITIGAPDEDQPDADRNGRLFLSPEGELRYEAPRQARSTVTLVYDVVDSAGNVSSAEITLHVLAPNDTANLPPVPVELTGRTVAGQSVTIQVPITTMDPDGDAVVFTGLGDEAPRLGTVTSIGPAEFVYEADDSSAGTDEFSYRVVDAFGQEATGKVLIGVAGRPKVNNAPAPVDDEFAVRPGQTSTLPVLANDSDPDGDPLTISLAEEHEPIVGVGELEVGERSISYTAPPDPKGDGTSFRYTVTDGRGLTRSATVNIVFRTDHNNRPPEARDDAADPTAVGNTVSLDLLGNDEDPDLDELKIVAVSDPSVTIDPDGTSVTLTMGEESFQFTYLVSDGELTARAAVTVPVVDPDADLPPIARLDDVEVDMGSSVTVNVLGNDEDPEGAKLHLLRVLSPRHGDVDIEDGKALFTASQENYAGDAGFYYVVGDSADPAEAKTAVGAVRVRINGTINTPPSFTQLEIEVAAGTETRVDLRTGVYDPDRDDEHDFEDLSFDTDGVSVDLDDGVLSVSAETTTPPGTTGIATFTVADEFDEVDGTALISVVTSDKPLAVVGADQAQTVQDKEITVEVLSNDTNPFEDTPLTIVDVGTPTGGASATLSGNDSITYDPGPNFFGTATITYRVADKTTEAAREVSGTLTVTVIGFPDAPPAPTCSPGEPGVSTVSWATPAANGAPITSYVIRVEGTGGGTGDRTVGTSSTQSVDGLDNGADYTFQVGAVNSAITEKGIEPRFSAPSPACRPDKVPDQPEAPTTQFGDKSLLVEWVPPVNEGTVITRYELTNTYDGSKREAAGTETSILWDGLDNGTCYQFTLTAFNAKGPSKPSRASSGEKQTCVPAGAPAPPAAPVLDVEPAGSPSGFILVSWERPDNNGADITEFELRQVAVQSVSQSSPEQLHSSQGTSMMVATEDGVDYEFSLRAKNKAGWSAFGTATVGRSTDIPDAPPTPTVALPQGDGGARKVQVTFSAPGFDGGSTIDKYEITLGGQTVTVSGPGTHTISGVPLCSFVTASVRAHNVTDGWGPWSVESDPIQTYDNPTIDSFVHPDNTDGNPTATWTSSRGGSCAPTPTVTFVDRNGSYSVAEDGSKTVSLSQGASSDVSIRIQTSGARGTLSDQANGKVSRKAPPPPPDPKVTLSGGDSAQGQSGCSAAGCKRFQVSWENLPSGTHDYACHSAADSGAFYTRTDGSAYKSGPVSGSSGSAQLWCYADPGASNVGDVWVVVGGTTSNTVSNW